MGTKEPCNPGSDITLPELSFFLQGVELPEALSEARPFPSDEDYIKHALVCLVARNSARSPGAPSELGVFVQKAEQAMALRCESASVPSELPRLERVAAKFALSTDEKRALQFVVLHNLGAEFEVNAERYASRALSTNLQRCAGLGPKELLDFLAPSRAHMVQGLIDVDDGFEGTFRGQSYKMQREVLAALLGGRLAPDEYLKIDNTAVAEVLQEEGAAPVASCSEAGRPQNSTAAAPQGVELALGSESVLSRLMGWASSRATSGQAAPGDAGAPGEVDDGDAAGAQPGTPGLHDVASVPAGAVQPGSKDAPLSLPDDAVLTGYADDLEYLADHFTVVVARLKIFSIGMREDGDARDLLEKQRPEARLRELTAQERASLRRCQARLALTRDVCDQLRVERLRRLLHLSDFEVWVVITLIGGIVSQEVRKVGASSRLGQGSVSFDVGTLLGTHCPENLKAQMANRRAFYRQAPLLRGGIVRLADSRRFGSTGDLMDCQVEMDRRMLDFCVGLDTEFGELVDAAHLYTPDVDVSRVVLPEETKRLILDTVENYTRFREYRKRVGLDDLMTYGLGVVLLFHGRPGTGKTMFANALAHHLGKKLLLVTMPLFAENPPEAVRQVFREATIENALVFFDECDALFESRDRSKLVTFLLTELERFDGLLILATNRVTELDEAMHRRVTLAVEFPPPDVFLREKIWQAHLPAGLNVAGDVDWAQLSMDFELSGGFIKNALVAALSFAVARAPRDCPDSAVQVTAEDLHRACKLQVGSQLVGSQLEQRLVPRRGLDALVLPAASRQALQRIVDYERARRVLQGQWGFAESAEFEGGTTCLFAGPRGTGKTLAAEAIAYELARPLRLISCLEVLTTHRTSKQNAATLLADARSGQAVLVLEGAEVLLTDAGRDGSQASHADFLLFHVERAGGVVILCCTTGDGGAQPAVPPHRLKFQVAFPRPGQELRAALWRKLLPEKAPLAADVDFQSLGAHFDLDGASIKSAVLRAAALAALRRPPSAPGPGPGPGDAGKLAARIRMADLEQAAREELEHLRSEAAARAMYA